MGDSDPAVRLDLFLKARIPRLSRRRIQQAIETRVEVPGHGASKPSTILRPGDTVIVRRSIPPDEEEPEARVPVLHRDEEILVVDKPAGLLAHPSNNVRKASLSYLLAREIDGPIHLVHRLDRETSGLMVIARSTEAARDLSRQVAGPSGRMSKSYLAILFGELRVSEGTIDLPIGKALRSAVYVKRGVNTDAGRVSQTRFRVERSGGGFSLVRAWLRTGRRHQIRVHFAAIGHPVVGDKLYGPAESHYLRFIASGFDEAMRRELLTERQMLHAADLEFRHPRDGRCMTFSAPLPEDMRETLRSIGLDR